MTSAWDGPIVDAHQHFWEPTVNNHPWLQQEARIPFRYGDYIALKRPYLPDDYKHDAAGQHIIQTVYVETEWDPTDPVGETRYASGLSERFGWPNAVVAQAWLNRPDVEEVLAEQARFPLVRSVRHKPEGPAHPRAVGSSRTLMSDPAWRNGFSLLGRYGLAFDLPTPWWNLDEAVALARDFPETGIILNHAGLPAQRDAESLAAWRAAIGRQPKTVAVQPARLRRGFEGFRETAGVCHRHQRAHHDITGAAAVAGRRPISTVDRNVAGGRLHPHSQGC